MRIKSKTFAAFLSAIAFIHAFLVSFICDDIMLKKFSSDSVWVDCELSWVVVLPVIVAVFINLLYHNRKEQIIQKTQAICLSVIVVVCIAFPYAFTTARCETSADGVTEYYITNKVVATHNISEAKEANMYFGASKDGSYFFDYEIVFKDGYTHRSQAAENEIWWNVFEGIDSYLQENHIPKHVYSKELLKTILEQGYDYSGVIEHKEIVEKMIENADILPI